MQLHYLLLLVAVVAFYGVDASASTKSKSIQVITGAIGEKDGPTTRILRSYDSEERINLTAWVKSLLSKSGKGTKGSKKLSSAQTAQLAKQASFKFDELPETYSKVKDKTVDEAFKIFELDNVKSVSNFFSSNTLTQLGNVDDLFKSDKFGLWQSYIAHMNNVKGNKIKSSVAKSISLQYGDEKAAVLFATAMKSSDDGVKKNAERFQKDLFTRLMKKETLPTLPDDIATQFEAFRKNVIEDGKKFAQGRANLDTARLNGQLIRR